MQADNLALTIGVRGHSDYRRDTDDPPALALLEVGGVEPEIGPFALQGAVQEGIHPLVDVLAEPADAAFGDPVQPHGLDEVLDAPGGDTADPGFLDHRDEGFFGGFPRLQEGREVAALAQLGDPELQRTESGVENAVTVAVAIGAPFVGSFMSSRADAAFDVGLHQELHNGLGGAAQKIRIAGLR